MSKINDKINDALGIDIEKVIDDVDGTANVLDEQEIKKYNERKEVLSKLKQDLKDARALSNKKWAEALLKNSAEKIVTIQEIFGQEIEDDPISKNVTAHSELSNALVNTVTSVMNLDREEEKIEISREKNRLREMEINNNGGGKIIDGQGKEIIGIGTNDDILKMINRGLVDMEDELNGSKENESNA
jgi:hypothetical protein